MKGSRRRPHTESSAPFLRSATRNPKLRCCTTLTFESTYMQASTMEDDSNTSSTNFMGNHGNDISFEDLVQNESIQKERVLLRISQAKRERSGSNLSLDKIIERPSRTEKYSKETIEDLDELEEDEEDEDGEKDGGHTKDLRKALFEAIPEPYPHTLNYQRVVISDAGDPVDYDTKDACSKLKMCIDIRDKWINAHPVPPQDLPNAFPAELAPNSPDHPTRKSTDVKNYRRRMPPTYEIFGVPLPHTVHHLQFKMVKGVIHVQNTLPNSDGSPLGLSLTSESADAAEEASAEAFRRKVEQSLNFKESELDSQFNTARSSAVAEDDGLDWTQSIFPVHDYNQYCKDYYILRKAIYAGPVMSYSYKRLAVLAAKFNLHVLLNSERELEAQKSVPHRDFYNCRKVDTHVHHSACMNQKHLLRFIKHKLKKYPNEAVIFRDGRFLTLGEVFMSLNLTAYDLSIDTLDMHANNTFHRFDRFNLKYNPAGQSRLREIFLKTDNVISGSYLAEITKEVIADLDASKYTLVEWRISIYGRKASEWAGLARWFYVNRLAHENVRWLIQIPRLYSIYKQSGEVESFGQMLRNIFEPLFAVSIDPSSNPPLHYFLQTVVGIDSVDDESRPEHEHLSDALPTPDNWTSSQNPPYAYWMYYTYANLCVLNKLRASRGLCTFQFRPHCGEAGDVDHLVSTYMCAHQINHGILLRKNASLQYLYYLSQIGIAMSPLSNNKLFLDYNKNPFPRYFNLGMNVSLSTDDPLMLHFTKDALLEEYSVAAQVWKLSATDQCEIARNSVLQSGFEDRYKRHFLGADYSDIRETNVSEIRLMYRKESLNDEIGTIAQHAAEL